MIAMFFQRKMFLKLKYCIELSKSFSMGLVIETKLCRVQLPIRCTSQSLVSNQSNFELGNWVERKL